MSQRRSFAVYCGARTGSLPVHAAAMAELGRAIAARGGTLVYGGGRVGLMGIVADHALAAGGRVIGVIPQSMVEAELAHEGLTELHVVDSMHARKLKMAELSDAFIAAPGGFGTFDELFEAITWTQLGIHAKPVGLFDVEGFYAPLSQMIVRMVEAGFVGREHADMLVFDGTPVSLLDRLAAAEVPLPRSEIRRRARTEDIQP